MKYPTELQKLYDKLQEKQKKFINFWNGNKDNTAKLAGYKAFHCAGLRAMKNATICSCIEFQRRNEEKPEILNRQERQKFWSDVMTGEIKEKSVDKNGNVVEHPQKMQDRLKASDLLGKSEGDFILRVKDESAFFVIKVNLVE